MAYPDLNDSLKYVVDGGALVQRIPWQVGVWGTHDKILQSYVSYVTKHYGQAVVVFDGYAAGPSTKDCTHHRPGGGSEGRKVVFNKDMTLQLKRKTFCPIRRLNKATLVFWERDCLNLDVMCSMQKEMLIY